MLQLLQMQKKTISLKTGYVLLYLLFLISGTLICFHHYISYDESYSMCLIRHSYSDIIRITALDVHPPLYYLLLKTWMLPFGESIPAARLFSLLIYTAFVSLGPLMVGRLFTKETGFLFTFFAITLPACQSYLYSEIRMYGLAALLVTACSLFAFGIAKSRTSLNVGQWVGLFTTGILGAYTQYYALIAVAFIYIALFTDMLCHKKLKKNYLPLLGCLVASCSLYIPWLFVLLRQFSVVSHSYWIGSFTLHTYLSFAAFPFYCSIHIGASFLYIILFTLMMSLMYWKAAVALFRKNNKHKTLSQNKQHAVLLFLLPYLMVIVTGCAVSLLVRPLFSARYIKCILGLLLLCFSVIVADAKQSVLKNLLVLFCAIFAFANFCSIYKKNTENNRMVVSYIRFLDSIEGNAVFSAMQSHLMGIHAFYHKNGTEYIPQETYTAELEAFSPTLCPVADSGQFHKEQVWVISEEDFGVLRKIGFLDGTISDTGPMFSFSDQTESFSIQYIQISP